MFLLPSVVAVALAARALKPLSKVSEVKQKGSCARIVTYTQRATQQGKRKEPRGNWGGGEQL